MSYTIAHCAFVNAANALLPLKAFFKQTIFHDQVSKIVNKGSVLVEIVRAVRPHGGRQATKDAIFDHHVSQHKTVRRLVREVADPKTDLTFRVILVMLIFQRIMEIAVFNPDEFLGGALFRILGVDPGHTMHKLDAHDFDAALIIEVYAGPVLVVVQLINNRFGPFAIGADKDGIGGCAIAFETQRFVPCVAAFQKNAITGFVGDLRAFKRFPGAGTSIRFGG